MSFQVIFILKKNKEKKLIKKRKTIRPPCLSFISVSLPVQAGALPAPGTLEEPAKDGLQPSLGPEGTPAQVLGVTRCARWVAPGLRVSLGSKTLPEKPQ